MSNLIVEINYLVEYFREFDRKFEQLKDSEEYKQWNRTPLSAGEVYESRKFQLVLWENTPRAQVYIQSVSKQIEFKLLKRVNKRF